MISVYAIPGIAEKMPLDMEKNRETRINEIFGMVCKEYMEDPKKVKKNDVSRKRVYTEIRMITIVLIREKIGLSYAQAGKFFGKDHATAIHAVKTY